MELVKLDCMEWRDIQVHSNSEVVLLDNEHRVSFWIDVLDITECMKTSMCRLPPPL